MKTVYVRLSDLQKVEIACLPEMDANLDVHIVADQAWTPTCDSDKVEVTCAHEDTDAVEACFDRSAAIVPQDHQTIENMRRQFGC